MPSAAELLAAKICETMQKKVDCSLSDLTNNAGFTTAVTDISTEVTNNALSDVMTALDDCSCDCYVWLNEADDSIIAVSASSLAEFDATFNGSSISGIGFTALHNQALALTPPVNVTLIAGQLHSTSEGEMKASVGTTIVSGPFKPCE